MTLILIIIVMSGLNVLEAYTDFYIQKSQSNDKSKVPFIKRWHFLDAIYKGTVFLMVALLIGDHWYDILHAVVVFSFLRHTIFEIVLNKLNKKKAFYVGKVAYIDSQFQKFSNPSVAMVIFKLLIFALLLGSGIFIF